LGSAWLFVHRQRIVGYAIVVYLFDLEFGGRCAGVTDLYLKPAHRRKGFGRRMLRHLEEFCRKSGFHALELQAERRNAGALAFYQACGFQRHDRIPMSKRL
jgi:GNAT superfamily N-acetyltransferase